MKKVNILLAVLLILLCCFQGCTNAESVSGDYSSSEDTYKDPAIGFYKDDYGNELDLFEDGSFYFEYNSEDTTTSFTAQGYWTKDTDDEYYNLKSSYMSYYINGEKHTGIELSGALKSSEEVYGSIFAFELTSNDNTSGVLKVYLTKE